MESNKSTVALKVTLTIFVIISIVLGCYLLYDKVIKTEDENKTVSQEITSSQEKKSVEETVEKTSKDNYEVIAIEPFNGIAVLFNGSVYVNFYGSTPDIDYVYGNGKYQLLTENRNKYQEYEFDNLKVEISSIMPNKWQKLDVSDAKYIHVNNYGQALSNMNVKYGILIQHNDNSVSYISYLDLIEGKNTTTKLNVENIESIATENIGGYHTYLVDSEGNKITANDLIK